VESRRGVQFSGSSRFRASPPKAVLDFRELFGVTLLLACDRATSALEKFFELDHGGFQVVAPESLPLNI
jgi:hypothetical protein